MFGRHDPVPQVITPIAMTDIPTIPPMIMCSEKQPIADVITPKNIISTPPAMRQAPTKV